MDEHISKNKIKHYVQQILPLQMNEVHSEKKDVAEKLASITEEDITIFDKVPSKGFFHPLGVLCDYAIYWVKKSHAVVKVIAVPLTYLTVLGLGGRLLAPGWIPSPEVLVDRTRETVVTFFDENEEEPTYVVYHDHLNHINPEKLDEWGAQIDVEDPEELAQLSLLSDTGIPTDFIDNSYPIEGLTSESYSEFSVSEFPSSPSPSPSQDWPPVDTNQISSLTCSSNTEVWFENLSSESDDDEIDRLSGPTSV